MRCWRRVVLTEAPPTLVFDEVDAGIGGEAGVAVGRLLATLGARHQVLCVTHLAQVAAFADTQVVVEKVVERQTVGRQVDGSAQGPRTIARGGGRRRRARRRAVAHARRGGRVLARAPPRRRVARHCFERAGIGAAQTGPRALILRLRNRKRHNTTAEVQGVARVDSRTKNLIPRLQTGEIAVIDHPDLDRVAADGLIEAGVVAVVNCSQSISGRYPNGGPIRVVRAGVMLVDDAGRRPDGSHSRG